MLTGEQQKLIKQEFIDTIRGIEREGSDVEGLIAYLESTDFFNAPASTQFHCSFPGGLCLHSLNVYKAIKRLSRIFASKLEGEEVKETYSEDTLLIVGLLHDLGKINYYETSVRNVKVYNNYGKKKDSVGYFDWQEEVGYAVKRAEDRELFGVKGFGAFYIINKFIPLTKEESITLTTQYSATEKEPITDLPAILSKYNLAVLLHSADILATYCIEHD